VLYSLLVYFITPRREKKCNLIINTIRGKLKLISSIKFKSVFGFYKTILNSGDRAGNQNTER
jgi:hypothetical protein